MNGSIFDKFLAKKKKDVLTYSQILEKVIEVENNSLWNNSKTFTSYAKEIIDYFIDNYYFDVKYYSNPIEYLKHLNKTVLLCITTYCEKENKKNILSDNQREVFLLIIIICMASYIDKSSNPMTGDYKLTKFKFKTLLTDLKTIKNINVNNFGKKIIQDLFGEVKKNVNIETKFFNTMMNTTSYNQYILYTNRPVYYLVKYHYSIPSLYEYNSRLVKKVNEEYLDDYGSISMDLLSVQVLKELIGHNIIYDYLVPIINFKKTSTIKNLDNLYLKKHIKVLVDFKTINENKELIKKLEDTGFKIIYDCSNAETVTKEALNRNMTVIINNKFKKNNSENLEEWQTKEIKFILKNNEEEVR